MSLDESLEQGLDPGEQGGGVLGPVVLEEALVRRRDPVAVDLLPDEVLDLAALERRAEVVAVLEELAWSRRPHTAIGLRAGCECTASAANRT